MRKISSPLSLFCSWSALKYIHFRPDCVVFTAFGVPNSTTFELGEDSHNDPKDSPSSETTLEGLGYILASSVGETEETDKVLGLSGSGGKIWLEGKGADTLRTTDE